MLNNLELSTKNTTYSFLHTIFIFGKLLTMSFFLKDNFIHKVKNSLEIKS